MVGNRASAALYRVDMLAKRHHILLLGDAAYITRRTFVREWGGKNIRSLTWAGLSRRIGDPTAYRELRYFNLLRVYSRLSVGVPYVV